MNAGSKTARQRYILSPELLSKMVRTVCGTILKAVLTRATSQGASGLAVHVRNLLDASHYEGGTLFRRP